VRLPRWLQWEPQPRFAKLPRWIRWAANVKLQMLVGAVFLISTTVNAFTKWSPETYTVSGFITGFGAGAFLFIAGFAQYNGWVKPR
jgi:hypothetical protein